MVPKSVRASHLATLVLMSVAYATCEVAAYLDGIPRPFGIAFGLAMLALASVLAIFVRPKSLDAKPTRTVSFALGALLVLPLLVEPLLRRLTDTGFPLEMQLVNGLRILGLLLAGLSAWTQFRRLAGVVALFLALFASAMGDQPAIPYLLVLFALSGGLWLVLEHQATDGDATTATATELSEQVTIAMPYRELVVFGVLALFAGAIAFVGPKKVQFALGELLPTSGGTGETDLFARYGIGDGPEEVAGDNARAAGMVESDKMIEDNKDALIDVVNDMYGPPHKPKQDQDRMVAAGLAEVIQNHKRLPDNRRPSREFDTSRKGPKSDKRPESQKARGIFEVEGRTPLHIRVVAYDTYDAANARWEEGRKPMSRLLEREDGDWMRITSFRPANWYAAEDRHRLKVADLKDNFLPTPANLTRFRIQRVDKADYYEWDYEGVLALAGRKKTPPGVVVNTDCRTLYRDRLHASHFVTGDLQGGVPQLRDRPESLKAELDRIAKEWTADQPPGWPQIAAVLARLKTDYTLDPKAVAPANHPAPAMWFLTESRRGPDYLFATSASLLLRSLGYSSRMCFGYYASPTAYDRETDHTPVAKMDVHLWPEVLLKDGHWLVVEPTPGYDVLPPLQTWREWFVERLAGFIHFVKRNAGLLLGLLVLMALVMWKHRQLLDMLHTQLWKLRPGRTWRQVVLNTARVIDRRGMLAGRPRSRSQSLTAWMQSLPHTHDPSCSDFIRLIEWAAYAPQLPPPIPEADVLPICQNSIREWSFNTLLPPQPGSSE